jgi:dihydrofolate synthase / folylpolyglutamate synthase
MSATTPEQLVHAFFYGRLNYEKQLPLDYGQQHYRLKPLMELLEILGNPHRSMAVVHVAGTKGKGSVSTMLHHVLFSGGYRCGLYTSPHIHQLGERFVVDGRAAEAGPLAEIVQELGPAVAVIDERSARDPDFGSLTFFDLCTATGFLYFYRQAVQIAVIEVGMGGRLDSTNVVDPLLSIITNVSLDHTQQLGNTVTEIVREKAGIIKTLRPVVSGVRQPEAREVVEEIARQQRAPLAQFDRHLTWVAPDPLAGPCVVRFEDPETHQVIESPPLQTPLLGPHQRDNVSLVFAATVYLRAAGWELSSPAILAGIAAAQIPGRLQIVSQAPRVVLDVAHNPASFLALMETLRLLDQATVDKDEPLKSSSEASAGSTPRPERRTLVFAVSRDKDSAQMLQIARRYFDRFVLTRFHNNPRALELDRLREILGGVTDPLPPPVVEAFELPTEAFQHALKDAAPDDVIVVAGSLFLLAEIGSWKLEQ